MSNHSTELFDLLSDLVGDKELHSRWLNTLSMMENIGARKISAGEHPVNVTETVLKHAAEEARHAYYLKRQIKKIKQDACPTYAPEYLINGRKSANYMHRLDSRISKTLREKAGLKGRELKYAAYVLVTYAVEVRADHVYGAYETALKAHKSSVSVRGILAEEEQHLAEMEEMIDDVFENGDEWRKRALDIETVLYADWMQTFRQELH